MTDHVTSNSRLLAAMQVCEEQPDWRFELLVTLCAVLAIALLTTLGQMTTLTTERDMAAGERDLWMEIATAEDRRPTVRLHRTGNGFDCRHFNIRREWEVAVAAECKVMGELLRLARAAP